MNEFKTLKDLEFMDIKKVRFFVDSILLKQLAIKWVKEDWNFIYNDFRHVNPEAIIKRWMKRLNITEEELKEIKK